VVLGNSMGWVEEHEGLAISQRLGPMSRMGTEWEQNDDVAMREITVISLLSSQMKLVTH
jgi:hypothetical protein